MVRIANLLFVYSHILLFSVVIIFEWYFPWQIAWRDISIEIIIINIHADQFRDNGLAFYWSNCVPISWFQFQFNGFNMMFPEARPFNNSYRCYSVSMLPGNERQDVEKGGKSKTVLPRDSRQFLVKNKWKHFLLQLSCPHQRWISWPDWMLSIRCYSNWQIVKKAVSHMLVFWNLLLMKAKSIFRIG